MKHCENRAELENLVEDAALVRTTGALITAVDFSEILAFG